MATAARRQNSYQQTNKQYVSSIINYKNTFELIIFSKHCFSNFSSSNIGDFTAVFGLLSRPCGLPWSYKVPGSRFEKMAEDGGKSRSHLRSFHTTLLSHFFIYPYKGYI